MSSTSTSKSNRNVLSIEKKIQVINRLNKGEKVTSLARIFKVGQATVSAIKSKKDEIMKFALQFDSEKGTKKRKYMRKSKDEPLDEAVYIWFVQRRSKGEPITGPLLCEKALELNIKLGGPVNFKASNGWLKNFKSRHGINDLGVQKESLSSDATAAENFKDSFMSLLKNEGYTLDDVYNADETGLNWKSLPHKALTTKREVSGFKVNKERVTLMVASNASGSHSLPLLMISKSDKPRCFKNDSYLPVCYKSHRSAWMNSEIFLDWYVNDFIPRVKNFREQLNKTGNVLLLLDNAQSHPDVERLNAVDMNFKVISLPLNVTALIQPMDQGIKEKLKKIYKMQVLHHLLSAQDIQSVVAFTKNLNLRHCCYMIADAWNTLSKENLQKAWNKLLINESKDYEGCDLNTVEELNEIAGMFQTIPGFSDCDGDDVRDWLENDNDPAVQNLNDEEQGGVDEEQPVMGEEPSDVYEDEQPAEVDDDDTEDEVEEKDGPSHEDALNALTTAMAWYEQQEESCPVQLMLLKKMRDLADQKMKSDLYSKR